MEELYQSVVVCLTDQTLSGAMYDKRNHGLVFVVIQNVKELWPGRALASADHDGGTNRERLREQRTRVIFKFSIGVNLL